MKINEKNPKELDRQPFFWSQLLRNNLPDDPILMLKFIQTSFIAIGLSKNYSDSITFLDKINFCLFMLLHELSCSFLSFLFF